jgi:branched-chain amino acid transport system ATP-binding protein
VLEVNGLTATYGGIVALRDASLSVPRGRIVALIGANGAGKTTLLHAICGIVRAVSGSVQLEGAALLGATTHQIARRGVLLVPEGRQILAPLSVRENLELGALACRGRRSAFQTDVERVFEMFPRLRERAGTQAGSLSGGEQQMLAIGRALMGGPEVLLLDEPSLGLAPKIVAQVFEVLQALNAAGLTILLVEQKARRALEIAHEGYVLERGQIVYSGTSAVLKHEPRIVEHYLGGVAATGALPLSGKL